MKNVEKRVVIKERRDLIAGGWVARITNPVGVEKNRKNSKS
ncbi:MAG: hypothetical protein V1915_03670 [Candidatus Bathyarchaeota archaeon]